MDPIKNISVPVTRRQAGKPKRAGHPALPADGHVGGAVGERRRQPGESATRRSHQFQVGEELLMRPGGREIQRAAATCRVVALIPNDSGPLRYRVRSDAESFERIVEEADLRSMSDGP